MAVHLCPVCNGKGIVDANFYNVGNSCTPNTSPVQCRTCKGEGILWDKYFEEKITRRSNLEDCNSVGDPKSKKVNWDGESPILNDGFLGKVGI